MIPTFLTFSHDVLSLFYCYSSFLFSLLGVPSSHCGLASALFASIGLSYIYIFTFLLLSKDTLEVIVGFVVVVFSCIGTMLL